jgi:hypothetical protein
LFGADEEVGRDLAAVDWAATPLGRPGSWPQSLQTAVDILLSSRFPMWMAWGPRLTFFCNAAYRRDTLGRKYPWALGRPASEDTERVIGERRMATLRDLGSDPSAARTERVALEFAGRHSGTRTTPGGSWTATGRTCPSP